VNSDEGAVSSVVPPDIALLGTEWKPRALLRAQLIEEGFEVLAADSWATVRPYLRPGSKPRLVIVDLQELPEPHRVLADLHVRMKPKHVLVLTALGTVVQDDIHRFGFHVVKRPVSIGSIVTAAAQALKEQEVEGSEGRGTPTS
jgi:DNA-binding response OmpR family regulator